MKLILCITGPSGAGKTTVAHALADAGYFEEVESHTTRGQRFRNETGHIFNCEAPTMKYLKHETVAWTQFAGNLYWVNKNTFEESKAYVYVISPDAVENVRQNCPDASVYHMHLTAPVQVLVDRMMGEGRDKVNVYERILHDKNVFAVVEKVDIIVDTTVLTTEQIVAALFKLRDEFDKEVLSSGQNKVKVQFKQSISRAIDFAKAILRTMESVRKLPKF